MNVYFDNSATTKICDEALLRYIEVSREHFGNPSSLHFVGDDALSVMESAKDTIMKSIGADSGCVVFTASGTEANNLAIFGRAYAKERYKGKARVITSGGEHASVGSPFEKLHSEGYDTVYVPTLGGVFDTDFFARELTKNTVLVTVMMVNNETGALYDIKKISDMMRRLSPEAVLHVDATQSYMKVPINVRALGIDMLTISSHKIEGPKGVGALYISDKVIKSRGITAQTLGGGQGDGLRSGTENVPGIAAFAAACEYAKDKIQERAEYINSLRDFIISSIKELGVYVLEPKMHAPHIINAILPKIKSQVMLNFLSERGISVSGGSACSSHTHHASSALASFGISDADSDFSIRISLSHRNTKEEAEYFIENLAEGIKTLQRVK